MRHTCGLLWPNEASHHDLTFEHVSWFIVARAEVMCGESKAAKEV